jgi:hypothetical protein
VTAVSFTPTNVAGGTPFTLTFSVTRTGEAGANAVSATIDAPTQALCAPYSGPALPIAVAASPGTTAFTWSCTAPAAGSSQTLTAQVGWVDVNTSVAGTPAVGTALVTFN